MPTEAPLPFFSPGADPAPVARSHGLTRPYVLTVGTPGPRKDLAALAGLTAADGTFIAALPRMLWALWRDDQHHAAKMHLQFDVLKGIPIEATITTGSGAGADAETAQLIEPVGPKISALTSRLRRVRGVASAPRSILVRASGRGAVAHSAPQ